MAGGRIGRGAIHTFPLPSGFLVHVLLPLSPLLLGGGRVSPFWEGVLARHRGSVLGRLNPFWDVRLKPWRQLSCG